MAGLLGGHFECGRFLSGISINVEGRIHLPVATKVAPTMTDLLKAKSLQEIK